MRRYQIKNLLKSTTLFFPPFTAMDPRTDSIFANKWLAPVVCVGFICVSFLIELCWRKYVVSAILSTKEPSRQNYTKKTFARK